MKLDIRPKRHLSIHPEMKNSKKTSKKKFMLLGVVSLLAIQGARLNIVADTFEIANLNDLSLPICPSAAEGNQIATEIRAANPSRYASYQINVVYFKPQGFEQLPTCFQNGYDSPANPTLYLDLDLSGATLVITTGTELNTESSVLQGHQRISTSPTITEQQISEDIWRSGILQGKALIALTPQASGDIKYYYFHDFGSWRGVCYPTCATCSGMDQNQCTTCHATSSLDGSTVNPNLAGLCLCPANKLEFLNRAPTCAASCPKGCKSCRTDVAAECINCQDGFEIGARDANGVGECVESAGACHETCETCSGPNADDCLTCKNISPKGQLTLTNRKECRCPGGHFYVSETKSCSQCHSDCSSCTGTGSDQCLICSDPKSIVATAPGPCVSCADPANKDKTECKDRVTVVDFLPGSASTPTTVASLILEEYKVAKAPVRVPNKGKHIIRLKLPDTFLQTITALGNQFAFTDFMKVSISGLTSPTDYTFSGAVNKKENTYDLTFNFAKDHVNVIVQFEVIQPNYFLLNLPPKTTRRRERRQLQAFSTSTQQLLNAAKLAQSGTIRANMSALSFNENILEGLEDAGIQTRIFLYASVFLFAMGIMMVMLASKYDG